MNHSTGGVDSADRGARVMEETAALDQDLRTRIVDLAQAETDEIEQFRSSGRIVAELAIWLVVAMLIFVAFRLWL